MVATRRSARQAQLRDPTPAAVPDPVAVDSPPVAKTAAKKQRPQASGSNGNKSATKAAEKEGAKKRAGASLDQGKNKKAKADDEGADDGNRLYSLPPEILTLVLNNIRDVKSMSALGRTCKVFYSKMMPHLYRRLAVAAMFHAHIPKLIRAIEPHLTIAQKKQLKKEGKYKGQQERYPTGLDEKAKPFCASYMQQLVVGASDPGKKHRYIVLRYIEEAMKSFENLEMVETRVLTTSIAKSLASLKSLKALNLYLNDVGDEDIGAMAKIKNLKHLSLDDTRYRSEDRMVMQSIIKNSASTLETLSIKTAWLGPDNHTHDLLIDWGKNITLESLRSLDLTCYRVEAGTFDILQKAIDFTKLKDLKIGNFEEEEGSLCQRLASLARSSASQGASLKLRRLSIDMADSHHWDARPERDRAQFEARCDFISSFDTLETLELPSYGQYKEDAGISNPGLSDTLLQAILKHKNLKTLRIRYNGRTSGLCIPYLPATTVRAIVDGLPGLREFEFAPDEEQMDQIGQALAYGTNLSSITCFPHASWATYPPPDNPGMNILVGIMKGFLNHRELDSSVDEPNNTYDTWEKKFNLKRVSISYKDWEVAPKPFGKSQKGMKKPEKIKSENERRQAWYRDVTGMNPVRIHVGYDPEFTWMENVAST